jgi:hypothetical protein
MIVEAALCDEDRGGERHESRPGKEQAQKLLDREARHTGQGDEGDEEGGPGAATRTAPPFGPVKPSLAGRDGASEPGHRVGPAPPDSIGIPDHGIKDERARQHPEGIRRQQHQGFALRGRCRFVVSRPAQMQDAGSAAAP